MCSAPARGALMQQAQTESTEHMMSMQRHMTRAAGREEEDEAENGALEQELRELAGAMAAPERQAAHAAALAMPAAVLEQQLAVGAGEMEQLLAQLRAEPDTDDERAAKFALYETFSETTQKAREALFTFWDGCKHEFGGDGGGGGGGGGGQAREGVAHALKRLDRQENWAIEFADGRWFVFDMARKCDANSALIDSTLGSIKTKLELLARQDDCPICLEPLAEDAEGGDDAGVVVLGCCHKVCRECWDEWVKLKRGRAFCPLCRNDEFLGDVVEGHGVPAPLWAQVRVASGGE
jgi:hypothetical protein